MVQYKSKVICNSEGKFALNIQFLNEEGSVITLSNDLKKSITLVAAAYVLEVHNKANFRLGERDESINIKVNLFEDCVSLELTNTLPDIEDEVIVNDFNAEMFFYLRKAFEDTGDDLKRA